MFIEGNANRRGLGGGVVSVRLYLDEFTDGRLLPNRFVQQSIDVDGAVHSVGRGDSRAPGVRRRMQSGEREDDGRGG